MMDSKNEGNGPRRFEFDRMFRPDSTQQGALSIVLLMSSLRSLHAAEVFESVGKPTVEALLNGFNSAIIAYGQTGESGFCPRAQPEAGLCSKP